MKLIGKTIPHGWTIALFAAIPFAIILSNILAAGIADSFVLSALAIAGLSLIIAYFFSNCARKRKNTAAKSFATVFLIHGIFLITLTIMLLAAKPDGYPLQPPQAQIIFHADMLFIAILTAFGFIVVEYQQLITDMKEEKKNLISIFDTLPYTALITRLSDGLFVEVNKRFLQMFGYSRSEIVGYCSPGLNLWYTLLDRQRFLHKLRKDGYCENMEVILRRKDESRIIGMLSARTFTLNNELHSLSVIRDVTKRKQTEEVLRETEETFRSIMNASPDSIGIVDLAGRILLISPAASKMFGLDAPEEATGMHSLDFILPEDHERVRSEIARILNGGNPVPNEYSGVKKNGMVFDIEVNSGLIQDADGLPAKRVIVVRDITERKQAEMQIQQLIRQLESEKNAAQFHAVTDSLTGLANRRHFDEALRLEFSRLKRSGSSLSLIILDVDHFKRFNDFYGHQAGDTCLKMIGYTLKGIVGRATDVVARYGGEEFVVILPETENDGAALMAERIRRAIAELAIPHATSATADHVTVSLGVVTISSPAGSMTPDQAVGLADSALYHAKHGGRNRCEISPGNLQMQ
jgi:diguanylate cyclase (GGDEF)-like protein/PAS domain S-box-containing protein